MRLVTYIQVPISCCRLWGHRKVQRYPFAALWRPFYTPHLEDTEASRILKYYVPSPADPPKNCRITLRSPVDCLWQSCSAAFLPHLHMGYSGPLQEGVRARIAVMSIRSHRASPAAPQWRPSSFDRPIRHLACTLCHVLAFNNQMAG